LERLNRLQRQERIVASFFGEAFGARSIGWSLALVEAVVESMVEAMIVLVS
jgi:hypothetical protein